MNPQVSVIIVNYNTTDLLIDCLDSIYDKTKDIHFEIVVVDNASDESPQEIINDKFKEVTFIENEINLGFAKANNLAIERSTAKYCFLLNPDTLLINNAIKIFYSFMQMPESKNIACCGGSIYDQFMTPRVAYGHFPTIMQIIYELGLKHIFRMHFKRNISLTCVNEDNFIKEVDYVTGAAIFIRKSALKEVGFLDEDFFMYFEETELCHRLRRSGWKCVILPEAKIKHLVGQSIESFSDRYIALSQRSKYLFYKKCYGLIPMYLARFLYAIKYLITFIIKRNNIHKKMLIETIKLG